MTSPDVWSISTFPDTVVLFGLTRFLAMTEEFRSDILMLPYDTAFSLEDFSRY